MRPRSPSAPGRTAASRSTTAAPSTSDGRSTPTSPATRSSSASSRPAGRVCAFQTTIAFPGQGYNRSRVSVLLPAPNVVDVIVPRTITSQGAFSFLARSVDGGRTFAPAVQLSGEQFAEAVQGPGGRIALADGPTTLRAGLFAPDGSSAGTEGSSLGPYLEGVFTDIAVSGEEVLAAGSDARHVPRLPARRRRRSQQRRRVAADRSRAGRPPAVGRGSARRLRGHARAHGPPATCSSSASRAPGGRRPSASSTPSATTASSSSATPGAA